MHLPTHHLVGVILLAAGAVAQQFARQPIAQTTFGATMVAIDLDGDGDRDLVALTPNQRGLAPFVNHGGLRFVASPRVDANTAIPLDFEPPVGDIDGDGDADMLLRTAQGNAVVVARNNAGSLTVEPAIPLGSLPMSLRLIDIDGDGDLDLLVRTSQTAQLLTNAGTGTFTLVPTANLPTMTGAPLVGDFDFDGRSDVAVATTAGLTLWMGRQGGLVDETATRLPAVGTPIVKVTAIDLERDGAVDLVGTILGTPSVFALRNNGGGVFTDVSGQIQAPPSARGVVPIDLDGDGDQDLLLDRNPWTNDGTGVFTPGSGQAPLQPLAAVDLDGDRFEDLATQTGVARNVPGRGLQLLTRCAGWLPLDVDADGDADLLGAGATWRNDGGTFAADTTATASPAVTARTGDLDGDGDPDFVERLGTMVRIWRNDGVATPVLQQTLSAPGVLAGEVALLDADGDGDLDLFYGIGQFVPVTPQLLRNDGNFTFVDISTVTLPNVMLAGTSFAAGDVDADGDDDVVCGGLLSTQLFVNQNGSFTVDTAAMAFGSGTVQLLQLDRDADLELLAVNNPALRLFDRIGTTWQDVTLAQITGRNVPVTGATAIDFDDDGDLDLALAGGGGELLQNDGNGSFTGVTGFRGPVTPTPINAVDVDGDGDLDLPDGFDVWINQQRQLTPTRIPTTGGQLALEFVAEPGFGTGTAVVVPIVSLTRLPRGMPLLGGHLFADPNGAQALPALVAVAGQAGTGVVPIPNLPTLRGLSLRLQGLVIGTRGELALANHLVTTIE